MKAELMSIGTELLLGQIVDTNAAYLAGRLALRGIDCLHMQTVGDNLGRATEAFRLALSRSELVGCRAPLANVEATWDRRKRGRGAARRARSLGASNRRDLREERRRARAYRRQGDSRRRRRREHRADRARDPVSSRGIRLGDRR